MFTIEAGSEKDDSKWSHGLLLQLWRMGAKAWYRELGEKAAREWMNADACWGTEASWVVVNNSRTMQPSRVQGIQMGKMVGAGSEELQRSCGYKCGWVAKCLDFDHVTTGLLQQL